MNEGTAAAESQPGKERAKAVTSEGVLKLEGVTVSRAGRPVVRDVSLNIPAGEVTALGVELDGPVERVVEGGASDDAHVAGSDPLAALGQ